MALTLLQKHQLTLSTRFLSRVTQAVRERAKYRLDGGGSPNTDQTNWARRALLSNQAYPIAVACSGNLVTDAAFSSATFSGTSEADWDVDLSDASLKSATELICEQY